MKKRVLGFLILLIVSLLLFASCSGLSGNGGGTDNGGNTPTPGDGNVDNTPKPLSVTQLVRPDINLDLLDVRLAVDDIVGILPTVLDTEPVKSGELVFGNTSRDITAKAKAELESILSRDSINDCGYIIYVDGDNVAVYWHVADMASVAIAKFIQICVDEKQLVLDDGVVAYEVYEREVYVKEKYWIALEAVAEPDVVEAIRKIYHYYNGANMVDWLANLYDPETGGIYYSRSARDNEPFLPDLESTAQGISFLINNNALSSRNAMPNELKLKFIEFARNMQSPVDGYFYHPQWPQGKENLATDRYGRDQGWATTLITDFFLTDEDGNRVYYYPKWCASNGTKCALHTGTGDKCSFPASVSYYTDSFSTGVTNALAGGVSSAVSRVTSSVAAPTASVSSHPDYSSRDAFSAWLEAYNETVKEDSGRAHNLAALKSEIAQHGYIDIVLDHLDRVQAEVFAEQLAAGEEPTGLWQRNVDYKAVWGLLKYMSFYNDGKGRKIDIKYVPYIAKTCVKVIELPPEGGYASNDLYNQWTGITNLMSNVRNFYGDESLEIIYEVFRDNAASLIDNSLRKIEPFRMEDGSFSARSDGMTSATIYSTNIALGVSEGNVNSTGLICSMYRAIFTPLGLPVVPLCTEEDGARFIETVLTLDPIEKNEIETGVLDFDNNKLPLSVTPNVKNPGASVEVVDDPEGERGYSLNLISVTGVSAGDGFSLSTSGGAESCYVFEADIYIDGESDDGSMLQIRLDEVYMIYVKKSGTSLLIRDSSSTSSLTLKSNDLCTAETDKWFKIRVEYFVNGEMTNSLEAPIIRIYLNDEFVKESDNFFGSQNEGAKPKVSYTKVSVLSPRLYNGSIFFDNIYCAKEDVVYE